MKTWKWLIGISIVNLAVVATIIVAGGNPILWFVDLASAMVLALFTLPVLLAVHGWKGYWGSFKLAFQKDPASRKDYRAARAVPASSIRMIYVAAFFWELSSV